jgi:micrococcal nuclease
LTHPDHLCRSGEVGLDVDDLKPKDAHRRTLAVVYTEVDGSWVNLNVELLRRGYAVVLYIPPSEFNPYNWV